MNPPLCQRTKSIFLQIVLVFVLAGARDLSAQNLDQLTSQQPFTLTGFISTNQVANNQGTLSGNALNYTDYYTGSLNFSFYGINVPLQFTYSGASKQGGFTHPFNQIGIHPSWKWIRIHAGYASMNFSPYSLGGHLFKGGGIEITPGKFRASAMAGELRKAVPYDSTRLFQPPSYRRFGLGMKAGFSFDQDYIDISVFYAADHGTLEGSPPETMQIAPQNNAVVTLSLKKKITSNFSVSMEYGNSALTTDIRTDLLSGSNNGIKPANWLIENKVSTINKDAFKAALNYSFGASTLGAGYERIDPDYSTLGSYYFTNNFENLTLNYSGSYLENKLSISTNAGLQRDNLDGSRMNNNNRFVGSANMNIVPGERLNFNLSYSNFLSYTNVRSTFDFINQTDPFENWDTLNYRQISQNVGIGSTYQLVTDKERRQILALNLTYQTSENIQGTQTPELSGFYNLNASHILSLQPISLNISTSMAMNRIEAGENTSTTWGPVVTISKLFFERTMRTSLSGAYNNSLTNGIKTGDIYNIRFGAGYTLRKQHQFNLNVLYQLRQRLTELSGTESLQTHSVTFAYVYNFSFFNKNGQSE
jgi:hypothetical protein